MALIKAYVYNTESDCQTAINLINTHFSIPIDSEAITRTYCVPILNNSKYIILANNELVQILGQPSNFEFIQSNTNP